MDKVTETSSQRFQRVYEDLKNTIDDDPGEYGVVSFGQSRIPKPENLSNALLANMKQFKPNQQPMITDSTAAPGENDRNACIVLGIQLRNELNLSLKGYDQLQVNVLYGKSQGITGTPRGAFKNPDSDGADGQPSKVAKAAEVTAHASTSGSSASFLEMSKEGKGISVGVKEDNGPKQLTKFLFQQMARIQDNRAAKDNETRNNNGKFSALNLNKLFDEPCMI